MLQNLILHHGETIESCYECSSIYMNCKAGEDYPNNMYRNTLNKQSLLIRFCIFFHITSAILPFSKLLIIHSQFSSMYDYHRINTLYSLQSESFHRIVDMKFPHGFVLIVLITPTSSMDENTTTKMSATTKIFNPNTH